MSAQPTALTRPQARIDWRLKGFWWPGEPIPDEQFVASRPRLFDGAFTWPLLVARQEAIRHNVATLAAFCTRHGLEFSPHGKTTMAPALFDAQLRGGAWGITAATANQVLAYHAFGVRRVLLANQLLDPGPLRWLAGAVQQGLEFLCYADSPAGVRIMSEALATAAGEARLQVLVELGHRDGRTGCRTRAELAEVARAVVAAPGLELAGVAGYEGGLPGAEQVGAFLDELRAATAELAGAGLLPPTVVVTAGGSAYFDLFAQRLGGQWLPGHRVRAVLRSGAYIAHDDGLYGRLDPFHRIPAEGGLRPALQLWAQVTSTPEPGLVIVGLGKREAPYDVDLPIPQWIRRPDGELRPAAGLRVLRLNDQHAFLACDLDRPQPEPGDLICFGISHPCTAFDKWQVIPVLDEQDTVVDLIRTYF